MKSVTYEGDWPITAGWAYSSGTLHASYDIAMPNGTRVNSPCDGEVLDFVTGVPNVPGGSGSPSNWVLIGHKDGQGRKRCHYLQHLSKATVKVGQKVQAGEKVGESGNSGNSSGPHLHWTYQEGWKNEWTRYDYLDNGGASAVYPPTKGEEETMPTPQEIAKAVWNFEIDVDPGDGQEMMPAKTVLREARNQAKAANENGDKGLDKLATLLDRTEAATLQNTVWDENLGSETYPKTKVRGALRSLYESMKARQSDG